MYRSGRNRTFVARLSAANLSIGPRSACSTLYVSIQGGSRTRTPDRAPRSERGVSSIPSTWTSRLYRALESNQNVPLFRRLHGPPLPARHLCGPYGSRTRLDGVTSHSPHQRRHEPVGHSAFSEAESEGPQRRRSRHRRSSGDSSCWAPWRSLLLGRLDATRARTLTR